MTVVADVNAPPVVVHATETPGTALPDLSVALAVSNVLLPATTATESALALMIAVAGPAVAVTSRFPPTRRRYRPSTSPCARYRPKSSRRCHAGRIADARRRVGGSAASRDGPRDGNAGRRLTIQRNANFRRSDVPTIAVRDANTSRRRLIAVRRRGGWGSRVVVCAAGAAAVGGTRDSEDREEKNGVRIFALTRLGSRHPDGLRNS